MTMLVTLEQAREHLKSDTTADDNDLTLKIHAASGVVLAYIKNGPDIFTDSSGEAVVDSNGIAIGIPFEVQAATLQMLGYLYKNRDGDPDKAFSLGMLPNDVTSLLYHYRVPSLR